MAFFNATQIKEIVGKKCGRKSGSGLNVYVSKRQTARQVKIEFHEKQDQIIKM